MEAMNYFGVLLSLSDRTMGGLGLKLCEWGLKGLCRDDHVYTSLMSVRIHLCMISFRTRWLGRLVGE